MSDRWMIYDDLPFAKAPNGICRWCGSTVPPGKQSWCSDDCVQKYMVRNNSGSARQYLFERDDGACARCGLETGNIERMLDQLGAYGWSRDPLLYRGDWARPLSSEEKERRVELDKEAEIAGWIKTEWIKWLIERGFNRWGGYMRDDVESLWQADHIVPVSEGGGMCGLDNYQTLCVPCHKAETAELAARQARKRQTQKANKDMPLFGGNYKVE